MPWPKFSINYVSLNSILKKPSQNEAAFVCVMEESFLLWQAAVKMVDVLLKKVV